MSNHWLLRNQLVSILPSVAPIPEFNQEAAQLSLGWFRECLVEQNAFTTLWELAVDFVPSRSFVVLIEQFSQSSLFFLVHTCFGFKYPLDFYFSQIRCFLSSLWVGQCPLGMFDVNIGRYLDIAVAEHCRILCTPPLLGGKTTSYLQFTTRDFHWAISGNSSISHLYLGSSEE